MIQPINCPYKGVSISLCFACAHHIVDTDQCDLATLNAKSNTAADTTYTATASQTYKERLKDYEKRREELLQLSKDALVDLILKRPEYY